jgi:hypothetical protein
MRALYSLLMLVLLGSTPYTVFGARVYLEPATTEVSSADTFYVPVRIDTQGECINAARVSLAYDPTVLSVQDITTGDSVFTLWTEKPQVIREKNSEVGTILFEGGVPGGYCGRVEGDPGLTNTLVRLVVSGSPQFAGDASSTQASIVLHPDTQVILNDGQGTPAPLTLQGTTITLNHVNGTTTTNVWLTDVKNDTIAPEFFDITLVTGPSVGNNKHYIAFSTVDKQSGIDHYEVLETDPDRFGFLTWVPRESYWVRGESPYVLRDQKLHSKILVKAIDKAGNERVVEYTPPMSALTEFTRPLFLVPVLGVLTLLALLTWYMRRRKGIKKEKRIEVSGSNHAD